MNSAVVHAAETNRESVTRNAKCDTPAKREIPKIGTSSRSDSHSTQSPG